jgi:hypothetical protein
LGHGALSIRLFQGRPEQKSGNAGSGTDGATGAEDRTVKLGATGEQAVSSIRNAEQFDAVALV